MSFFKRLFKKPEYSAGGSEIIKHPAKDEKLQLGFSNAPGEWQDYREELYYKFLGNSEDAVILHEIIPLTPPR